MKATAANGLDKWECPKNSKIYIREIVNTHGGKAFEGSFMVTVPSKVTGTGRKRRQFKTKTEAERFATDEFRGAKKQGEEYFKATADERREFTEALPLLREKNLSLREAIEFALPRLRPEGGEKAVAELVGEMVASKEAREAKGQLRERSVSDFRNRSKRFADFFGDSLVRDLTAPDLKAWLQDLELSARSIKNYVNVVSEILTHAKQSQLIVESPLDAFTDMERKELYGDGGEAKQPAILTVSEVERLLNAAATHPELNLLPAITLGLFCGLRTEEIKRLDWKDIHLGEEEPFVTVGSDIAKKRRIRNVDLPANATQWLSKCTEKQGRVFENKYICHLYRHLHRLLEYAGIGEWQSDGKFKTRWGNNAMRHSFGSYHFALHGNSLETSRLLGHKANDEVLFGHYRALAKKTDGEKFFSINPAAESAKIVGMAG